MSATKEEILESIAQMSVMDVCDLVKMMEDKFGVSAAAPVAAAAECLKPRCCVFIIARYKNLILYWLTRCLYC